MKIRKLVKRPAHILLDDGHYLKKSLLDNEITAADLQNNHQRRLRPQKNELNLEPFDVGAYLVGEEGMKERKELYDSKLQLINYKLNQSISKPLASFVVTSFVSDAYCKRENLENQL